MLSMSRPSPDPGEDDASLIAASRTEPERFAELFHRHAPAILRYVTLRLGRDAAEDGRKNQSTPARPGRNVRGMFFAAGARTLAGIDLLSAVPAAFSASDGDRG